MKKAGRAFASVAGMLRSRCSRFENVGDNCDLCDCHDVPAWPMNMLVASYENLCGDRLDFVRAMRVRAHLRGRDEQQRLDRRGSRVSACWLKDRLIFHFNGQIASRLAPRPI
eukprot:5928854-Pleurochrysis_carterae.AAC.3